MPLNEHEKALAALMDQAGIVINLTPAPSVSRDSWNAAHYRYNAFSTKARGGVQQTGLYSMGWGHFKATDLPTFGRYAKHGGAMMRSEAFHLLTKGRDDSPTVADIRRTANNARKPEPVQVMWSLLMDAQGADQPFADWAGDLGYSDDSIKAKEIWETVNDTRRFLQSVISDETLAAMYDAASEI